MKRLALRLAVASLTFTLGATAATFLFYRHGPSPLSKVEVTARSQSANQPQPAPTPVPSEEESDPLEAVFIKEDRLSYAGYDVERSFDEAKHESSATIKKNGKVLATLNNGGLFKESTRMGLFPFLGGETKQLIILQYTGGAHCCWIYKIYDFTPRLRLIFDGEKYGIDSIGYELNPDDMDGDGRYEFTQAVMTFDYFHMSHSVSVFPSAVFSYDEKRGIYLPANQKFSSRVLQGLEEDLKRVEDEGGKLQPGDVIAKERYLSTVLRVTLKYIYAGQATAGWEFYDREYQLSNRGEIKADIRTALKSDPIYRSIYPPGGI